MYSAHRIASIGNVQKSSLKEGKGGGKFVVENMLSVLRGLCGTTHSKELRIIILDRGEKGGGNGRRHASY